MQLNNLQQQIKGRRLGNRMKSSWFGNLHPLILLIFALSCSKTATVYTKDGAAIEGDIRRSDASTVFVYPSERQNGDRAHPDGIFARDIFDECVADRTTKCRKKCRYRHSIGDNRQRCMKSCLNHHNAMEICRPISVVIPVSRSDIKDIRHPGKTAALVSTLAIALGCPGGYLLMVYGGATYGDDGFEYRTEAGPILAWIGLFIEAAVVASVFVAIWGYAKWTGSRSAATPPKDTAGPKISPVAVTDGRRMYYGLGFTFNW
jgi:hypothetical protein